LLDALRDHLDLTGTKKGFDHGQCGACTPRIVVRHHSAAAVTEGDALWMGRRSRIAAGALVKSGGEAIRFLR
jgi:hypothetical protein